jgi:hypothetical protein
MATHPLTRIGEWMADCDFAVLAHGFSPHGRDYMLMIEDCLGRDPGRHELVFTHCVTLDYETRVRDDVWPVSWGDEFVDYQQWKAAGEPDGYVWGTEWSNAYPGFSIVPESSLASDWSRRIGHPFFEATLETDRFFLRIVFHDLRHRKVSGDTSTISQVTVPLP